MTYGWMGRTPDYKASLMNTLGANHAFSPRTSVDRFAKRVERTRADISEHDSQAAERKPDDADEFRIEAADEGERRAKCL